MESLVPRTLLKHYRIVRMLLVSALGSRFFKLLYYGAIFGKFDEDLVVALEGKHVLPTKWTVLFQRFLLLGGDPQSFGRWTPLLLKTPAIRAYPPELFELFGAIRNSVKGTRKEFLLVKCPKIEP